MGEVATKLFSIVSCGECISCHVPIFVTSQTYDRLLESKVSFYCVNGHPQRFVDKTPLEKERDEALRKLALVERQRDWANERANSESSAREHAERSANSYKGKLGSIKKRVGNGVCPCCQRSFVQLARHMATKHPTFIAEQPES